MEAMGIAPVNLLIRRACIVDPAQGMDGIGDLLIRDGRLVAVGGHIERAEGASELDGAGLIACPGLVDLHCHLREPGFERKESISTGTAAAAAGGFVAICCMPNTDPPLDTRERVQRLRQRLQEDARVEVFPIACVSRGRGGKELVAMEELAAGGVVGFSDDGDPVATAGLMREALLRSRKLGLPIIDHCEDRTLAGGTFVNEGAVSARLAVRGNPSAAEEVMVARDLALARATGGHLHVAHVSTAGSVEMLRHAREAGVPVTAEVTPHHLLLTEEATLTGGTDSFDTNAKVNPPLRSEADRRAVLQGVREGTIDVIATDHAPHTPADKEREPACAAAGISEFDTALGCLLGLVHSGELRLDTLISRLTRDPARLLGKEEELGRLHRGRPANLTLIDPERLWTVDPGKFLSKGRNTPFAGRKVKGKVVLTVAHGVVVYCDERLDILGTSGARARGAPSGGKSP